ncbi:MAG: phosphoglucosamine mutase [gamma proteobacterium symbiont of Bathyaustriella thionipta]|nr:phosphoglucosamine mutase [gamma proteobacterium symbiont of Bathyaustriella thionipta]
MTRKYFGTDGIRGRVGQGVITPEFVLKLGWAAGQVLGGGRGGRVVIGKDTRLSGYLFESALEAGLSAGGADILLLGPMPTPAIAYLTRALRAQAGIVISASHNPYEDNGIKFFRADGDKLADEVEHEIETWLEKPLQITDPSSLGKAKRVKDAAGRYVEFCKSTISQQLSLSGLTIALDCAHGATYHVAPLVFEELGATLRLMGAEPDGLNINDGVGSTQPQALCDFVVETGADFGVAFDGDGDRLAMVDSRGQLLDGDDLLYIIASSRSGEEAKQPLVGTVMTNMGLEHALSEQGIALHRTRVGDRYILQHLKQNHWSLGGEPSGHIICRNKTTTGDGIIAALQVIEALLRQQTTLQQAIKGFQHFPQVLKNIQADTGVLQDRVLQQLTCEVEKQLGQEGRVLIRASGTEPLVRVMVEGRDAQQVERLSQKMADCVAEQA